MIRLFGFYVSKVDFDKVGGLLNLFFFCKDVKVMLSVNFCV